MIFTQPTDQPDNSKASSGQPRSVIGFSLLLIVALLSFEWTHKGDEYNFDFYGLNSIITMTAVTVLLSYILSPKGLFIPNFRAFVLAGSLMCFALAGLMIASPYVYQLAGLKDETFTTIFEWTYYTVYVVLWLAIIFNLRKVIRNAQMVRWPGLRAIGIIFGIVVCLSALPVRPTFRPEGFNQSTSNVWELAKVYTTVRKANEAGVDHDQQNWASIEAKQPRLMKRYLAGLPEREAGKSRVFLLGVAGWAEQGIFTREAKLSLGVMQEAFEGTAFPVMLANNSADTGNAPMATVQNIAHAIQEIGSRMDPERDLLILALTSHGSKQGFALQFDGITRRNLDPETLKELLREAGIRNRVIVVSACHSGTFVPAFQDENSVVITAASADKSSFGCTDRRELTFFGQAFFKEALPAERNLTDAFAKAKQTISGWENEQSLKPSEPQIWVGQELQHRFPKIIGPMPLESAKASAKSAAVN
ncbi:MAG: C13 family peptidase [Beijerinckiaceae bacterium]